jgi:hypothetical protein
MQQENYNFYPNFEARNDLKKYNDNALLLYTLQLRFGIEDIEEVAINSLVDGNDDKKTDLVYIDDETGEAIIAQGFFASVDRSQAPSNKASDLNTAVTWLLTRELNDLPDIIRSAAQELRQKIENNTVKRITLWYSHNLPESQNVKNELKLMLSGLIPGACAVNLAIKAFTNASASTVSQGSAPQSQQGACTVTERVNPLKYNVSM